MLARRGLDTVSPNPAVGAVVVRGNEVVGEGWHVRAGSDHAEVIALAAAGEKAAGSTLYVNLEPCCHWGRTPPCTDAIIKAGVSRVVACTVDPNPAVGGKGFAVLENAGIDVDYGHLVSEAERLNEVYFHWRRTGRPFVHLIADVDSVGSGPAERGGLLDTCSYARQLRRRL